MVKRIFIVFVCLLLLSLQPVWPLEPAKSSLVTIDFKDTDIKDVLRALGAQQGVNIITEEALAEKVTIHLTNVPFEIGLSALLTAHGLSFTREEGNIYKVTRVKGKPYTLKVENNTLSLDAKNVDINEVLREIALASGINIITDKTVSGNISTYFNKVPIEDGLERILKSSGFDYKKVNEIYLVGKSTEERIRTIEVKDGLLSLDLKEADIFKVLREISIQAGINIVADSSVSGVVSSHLEKTPLEVGLRALLEANDFTLEKMHDIYHVSRISGRKTFSIDVTPEGLFTVDLRSAELDEVLRAISRQGNIDMVISGYVRGKINAQITNASLEKLLRLMLEGTNFTFAKVEDIYVIGEGISLNPTSLTFINSELIKINWLDVEETLKILPDAFPRANIRLLKDQNALVVVGTSQLINKLKAFIANIDKPAPQIMIEILVVDFTSSWRKDVGIEEAKAKTGQLMADIFPAGGGIVPLPLTYYKKALSDEFFSLQLRAMVKDGKAKIRANPKIATLNGHEASLDVLTKYRYREIIETGDIERRFQPTGVPREIETGIKVRIRPWVTASNEINVEVVPEISNKTGETEASAVGGALPVTSERRIKTNIRVKDGETIIIGGLIQSQKTESVAKVPFLNRIPILGYLFKQKRDEDTQTELVIYITPHLLMTK